MLPTPQPIPAARARVIPAPLVRRWRRCQRSEQGPRAKRPHSLALCSRFSSVCSCPVSRFRVPGRQSLVSLRHPLRSLCPPRALCKVLSFSPVQYRPGVPPSDTRQIIRWIHSRGLPNYLEHPTITGAVSISEASPQIQILLRRDSPDGPSLRLAKHRFTHDSSSPSLVFLFQTGSANAKPAGQPPRAKFGFQFESRLRRQHFQRAAHDHNQVPTFHMPSHLFDCIRIQWDRHSCLSPSFPLFFAASSSFSFSLIFHVERDRNVCPTTFHIHSHAP